MKSNNKSTTNFAAVKAVKHLTSLMIKNQKQNNSVQLRQTDYFLSVAKAAKLNKFLTKRPYVVIFRFIETFGVTQAEFFKQLPILLVDTLRIDDTSTCRALAQAFGQNLQISQLLSSGGIYVTAFDTEFAYLRAVKALIAAESADVSAMCGLVAAKDGASWVNLQLPTPGAALAREFYLKWDSKESILIELTSALSAPALSLTSILQGEVLAGTSFSLPQVTILPKLNQTKA